MRPTAQSELLHGLNREFIPSPGFYVPVSVNTGNAILRYTARLAEPYDGVPKLSKDSALVVNRFGKGRVVYFSGDIGNSIAKFHTPELLELVANAGREMADLPIAVDNVPCPSSLSLERKTKTGALWCIW